MTYESSDVPDDFDPPSALAASDGLTFRYEVLIESLRSRIAGAICLLVPLAFVEIGTLTLYFAPLHIEISAAAYSFIPSLLVILLFALASTALYTLTLISARRQAQVALVRLELSQRRIEEDLTKGFWK